MRDHESVYMHHEAWGGRPPAGFKVDHINLNTLDNRASNLRLATNALNAQNQGSRGGSSKHRGVSWCKTRCKWVAQCQLNGRKVNLGRYDKEEDAVAAVVVFRAQHMPFSADAREAEVAVAA